MLTSLQRRQGCWLHPKTLFLLDSWLCMLIQWCHPRSGESLVERLRVVVDTLVHCIARNVNGRVCAIGLDNSRKQQSWFLVMMMMMMQSKKLMKNRHDGKRWNDIFSPRKWMSRRSNGRGDLLWSWENLNSPMRDLPKTPWAQLIIVLSKSWEPVLIHPYKRPFLYILFPDIDVIRTN